MPMHEPRYSLQTCAPHGLRVRRRREKGREARTGAEAGGVRGRARLLCDLGHRDRHRVGAQQHLRTAGPRCSSAARRQAWRGDRGQRTRPAAACSVPRARGTGSGSHLVGRDGALLANLTHGHEEFLFELDVLKHRLDNKLRECARRRMEWGGVEVCGQSGQLERGRRERRASSRKEARSARRPADGGRERGGGGRRGRGEAGAGRKREPPHLRLFQGGGERVGHPDSRHDLLHVLLEQVPACHVVPKRGAQCLKGPVARVLRVVVEDHGAAAPHKLASDRAAHAPAAHHTDGQLGALVNASHGTPEGGGSEGHMTILAGGSALGGCEGAWVCGGWDEGEGGGWRDINAPVLSRRGAPVLRRPSRRAPALGCNDRALRL